jgi:DNA-binding NarL/FixJ family response regulator
LTNAIVIDDDPIIAKMISEFLELKKIQVLGIGYNGKDAVALYQKFNPDVVFLDAQMPNDDGFYGFKELKKLNSNATVIMLIDHNSSDLEDKFEELGISAVIYKSLDMKHFFQKVGNVLKKR